MHATHPSAARHTVFQMKIRSGDRPNIYKQIADLLLFDACNGQKKKMKTPTLAAHVLQ